MATLHKNNPIIISLGSSSPHKVKACDKAINWLIENFGDRFHLNYDDVETGVPKQPIGHNEIMLGAENRAFNIYKKYPDSDYTLGIESGLIEVYSSNKFDYKVYDVAAIRLLDHVTNNPYHLKCWSSSIEIPTSYYEHFLEDKKINPDITLGQSCLKRGLDFDGNTSYGFHPTDITSYLTNNLISRSDLLIDPIKLTFAEAFKSEKK